MAPFLSVAKEGLMLSVKLQPRASRDEICGEIGGALKIRLRAPPVDSAANESLVVFLADKLACSKGQVRLIRGQTSRQKLILLIGLSIEQVEQRLRG